MQLQLFKTCIKCSQTKLITEFGKDKLRPDGRFPYCKRCRVKDQQSHDQKQKGLKQCPDCQEWKTLDAYYSNKNEPRGVSSQCKECANRRAKNWRHTNPEAYKKKIWKLTWSNPQERKRKFKEYYEKNKDEQRARVIAYSKTPEGKAHQARANHKRRAWVTSAPATLTDSEWQNIIASQHNRCAICKTEFTASIKPTRDHIIPVSKGGGLTKENTQALCKSCNSRKRDH